MPGLPTVAEVKEHIETDMATTAIQRLIDGEDAEVVSRFGAHTTQTDDLRGGSLLLFLTRAAASVTSITETLGNTSGLTDVFAVTSTVLAANDYVLRHGGASLERKSDGANPRNSWGAKVTVIYVPVDDTARRKRLIIDLVKLAIQYNAVQSQEVGSGDSKMTFKDYQDEREALLSTLFSRQRMFA